MEMWDRKKVEFRHYEIPILVVIEAVVIDDKIFRVVVGGVAFGWLWRFQIQFTLFDSLFTILKRKKKNYAVNDLDLEHKKLYFLVLCEGIVLRKSVN